MTFEGYIVIVAVIGMIIALIKDSMRPGLVFFTVATLFMVSGIISPQELVAGFSNKGMLTVAVLFLVSEGVRYSGILNKIASFILPKKEKPLPEMLLRIMLPISTISAFLNNTPVVVIFAPIIKRWAEKLKITPQKFLIPLSYATIFGGMCTLIGTSTNLMVNGMMTENGIKSLGMFELGRIGIIVAIVGLLYVSFIGRLLLPKKKNKKTGLDETDVKEYFFNLTVPKNSKHIGEVVSKGRLASLKEIKIVAIERGKIIFDALTDTITIQENDEILASGYDENIENILHISGFKINAHGNMDEILRHEELHRIEVVLAPRFPGIGSTLEEFDFYNRYKGIVLAIHRNGSNITSNLSNERLRVGDSLVILADEEFVESWSESKIFFLITSKGEMEKPVKTFKIGWTITIVLLMIAGATFGHHLPALKGNAPDMFFFASLAAVAMAVLQIFPPKKYTRAISWDVLITIALAFAISKAMVNSGAAHHIALTAINSVKHLGPGAVLAIIYFLTMIFTEVITNNAAAAITFPIAMAAAHQLGVDPRPFFIAICVAASASFSTPIGYQTNLIVQAIGNYKFKDFSRIGIPLNIITFILASLLIPLLWKF
jgi:di/tricarboxylate transporter